MRTPLAAFAPAALLLTFAACGAGDSHAVGTYHLDVDELVAQMGGDMPAEAKAAAKAMMSGSIELKADHKAHYLLKMPMGGDMDETGTWSLSGDQLTIEKDTGDEGPMTVTLKDGTITMTEENAGRKMTIQFKKKAE